jgi:hypothetical protein
MQREEEGNRESAKGRKGEKTATGQIRRIGVSLVAVSPCRVFAIPSPRDTAIRRTAESASRLAARRKNGNPLTKSAVGGAAGRGRPSVPPGGTVGRPATTRGRPATTRRIPEILHSVDQVAGWDGVRECHSGIPEFQRSVDQNRGGEPFRPTVGKSGGRKVVFDGRAALLDAKVDAPNTSDQGKAPARASGCPTMTDPPGPPSRSLPPTVFAACWLPTLEAASGDSGRVGLPRLR